VRFISPSKSSKNLVYKSRQLHKSNWQIAWKEAKKMAVKITVRPSATATSTIDVSEEVKKDVETAYKSLKANPNSELHIAFADEKERLSWTAQARAYCNTRANGALRFRQLPSKNLPDNEGRYNITDDLEKNGERQGRRATA
jgi:hypothetical protein